jgi:type II secretory pathway pseudopilin PulG
MATHETTNASYTRPLILEVLLDIAIFAICAIVAVAVIMTAAADSSKATMVSGLLPKAQSMAEAYQAGDINDSITTYYYDSSFVQTDEAHAAYIVSGTQDAAVSAAQKTTTANISFGTIDGPSAYSIDVSAYPGAGSASPAAQATPAAPANTTGGA